jgi:hypothetical protein
MDQIATSPDEPEHWLSIAGFEGCYEVSDLGRVRSLLRVIRHSDGKPRTVRGGILKATVKGHYFYVCLNGSGRKRDAAVHVLVAETFIGPRPDGQVVCHGPGGKLDNRAANLSYDTQVKNCGPDRYRDGTILLGIQCPMAKLDDEKVREIRAREVAGETRAALAREFGVSRKAIIDAVTGRTWRHVA